MTVELVVGLGNPGMEFVSSRHNVGYRVVDELARRHAAGGWRRHPLCALATTTLAPQLILAKPLTYMNRSGQAVVWLLERLALDPSRMLVVVDDVDLPLPSLRLRGHGGPGTHNGLRDISAVIGDEYLRLRVGVRGTEPVQDLADYVLAHFAPSEAPVVDDLVVRAADAVERARTEGLERAMSEFNRRPDERDPD